MQYGSDYGLDIPCKNYGGTDIPAGRVVLLDTSNVAGADAATGVVLPTASGGVAGTLGITVEILYAGKVGRVRVAGMFPVIANGSITAGNYVQASDTTAKLGYVKALVADTEQIGQALDTVADGETCRVLICKAANLA